MGSMFVFSIWMENLPAPIIHEYPFLTQLNAHWAMRLIGWDTEVLNNWFTCDYQSLVVRFRGPRGVIDLYLWISVIAGLCELRSDGPEGLLLRILWESLILYMGCELQRPLSSQVWPPRSLKQIHGCCFSMETSWWHHWDTLLSVSADDVGACADMLVFKAQMGIGGRGAGNEFTFSSLA